MANAILIMIMENNQKSFIFFTIVNYIAYFRWPLIGFAIESTRRPFTVMIEDHAEV